MTDCQNAPRETGGSVTCLAGAGQTAAALPDPHTLEQALALRAFVPDGTLLDWLDLERLLPPRPCFIETEVLRRHWHCTQPTVSRRITRLWEAGLLDYRAGGGLYRIRRLGPAETGTRAPLITRTRCGAVDLGR